jgi:hypothetical protein
MGGGRTCVRYLVFVISLGNNVFYGRLMRRSYVVCRNRFTRALACCRRADAMQSAWPEA